MLKTRMFCQLVFKDSLYPIMDANSIASRISLFASSTPFGSNRRNTARASSGRYRSLVNSIGAIPRGATRKTSRAVRISPWMSLVCGTSNRFESSCVFRFVLLSISMSDFTKGSSLDRGRIANHRSTAVCSAVEPPHRTMPSAGAEVLIGERYASSVQVAQ
jgi:hypothetical protein